MSTWHQDQAMKRNPISLFHKTEWTVVIDPPNALRYLYRTSTRALADIYILNLKANNPDIAKYAYILPPANKG
jgi:hypothetical protein